METIKIAVEVSVNLSESTQTFIKSLFGFQHCQCNTCIDPEPAPAPAPAPASTSPAFASAPAAPVPAPAFASTSPTKQDAQVSIDDVRKALAEKVNAHRDAIKQKLNEFGAPSVTKLDPAKYNDMYNFLINL